MQPNRPPGAQEVYTLVADLAERIIQDPGLADLVSWNGGLEPYLRSAAPAARGWSSMGEVPYVTLFPGWDNGRIRTWADRAFVLAEEVGVLADVSAAHHNGSISSRVENVPIDMAALIATDWPGTRQQEHDEATDPGWVRRVGDVTSPWVAELLAVWGKAPLRLDIRRELSSGLRRGIDRLKTMLAGGGLRRLPDRVESVLMAPPDVVMRRRLGAEEIVLFSWVSPIRAGDPMPRAS